VKRNGKVGRVEDKLAPDSTIKQAKSFANPIHSTFLPKPSAGRKGWTVVYYGGLLPNQI